MSSYQDPVEMMEFTGRVWCFDDNINTDLILPTNAIHLPAVERSEHLFSAHRPGWSSQVRAGDVLVAGRNFGMGSARAAAEALKNLGIVCLLAESLNGLFLRNCVNSAFPAFEAHGVRSAFAEGDTAKVEVLSARFTNLSTGATFQAEPWPEFGVESLKTGGLVPMLEALNLLEPEGWRPKFEERR